MTGRRAHCRRGRAAEPGPAFHPGHRRLQRPSRTAAGYQEGWQLVLPWPTRLWPGHRTWRTRCSQPAGLLRGPGAV